MAEGGGAQGLEEQNPLNFVEGGRERLVFFIDLHDDKQGVAWPTLVSGSKGVGLTSEQAK